MTVHHSSSTSLVVKWSHLQEEYFQGQPIGYKINYYPENLEREMNFWTVNYTTSAATLTNLTIYTLYTVKVSAVSSGGVGPANTVKAQTGAEGKKVNKNNNNKNYQCSPLMPNESVLKLCFCVTTIGNRIFFKENSTFYLSNHD